MGSRKTRLFLRVGRVAHPRVNGCINVLPVQVSCCLWIDFCITLFLSICKRTDSISNFGGTFVNTCKVTQPVLVPGHFTAADTPDTGGHTFFTLI